MCACCFTNMKLTCDLFCECALIMMQLIMVHIHAVLVWNVCVSCISNIYCLPKSCFNFENKTLQCNNDDEGGRSKGQGSLQN